MKRLTVITGVSAALLAGAGSAWWLCAPGATVFYTDAEAIRRPQSASVPRDILWRPPVLLDAPLNTAGDDYEPRFAWDGLTLYFVRGKAGENADIYLTRRTPTGWDEPQPVPGINGEYDDLGPEPAADGETLYFYSNRPGGLGGYDLWMARRHDGAWQPPTNLGPTVNSTFNDYGPAVTPDGGRLLFSSNRPQGTDPRQPTPDAWPATLREDLFYRTYDLYSVTLSEHGPSAAEPLAALNTPANEGAPCISPVGDFVYFSSDRPGGAGGFDLYRARLIRGVPQAAAALGDGLNTAANELDPGLTQLGYALYFSSDRLRPGAARLDAATPDAGLPGDARLKPRPCYDLYVTAAREVFAETEPAAAIDWAALLAQIWPHLTWLLLGLVALVLLLAFLRDMKDKRLSLLARCLLLSLLAHLMLLVSFSFWRVAAGVAAAVRGEGGGPIQVSVAGPAAGGDIAWQVRGELTAVAPPTAHAIATPVVVAPAAAPPIVSLASIAAPPTALAVEFKPAVTQAPGDANATPAAPPAGVTPLAALDGPTPLAEVNLPAETPRVAVAEDSEAQPTVAWDQPADSPLPRLEIPTSQPAARRVDLPVNATNGELPHAAHAALGGAGTVNAGGAGAIRDATSPAASELPPVTAPGLDGLAAPAAATALHVSLPAAPSVATAGTAGDGTTPRVPSPTAVAVPTPAATPGGVPIAGGGATFVPRDVPTGGGAVALAADVALVGAGGSAASEARDAGFATAGNGAASGAGALAASSIPLPDIGGLPGLGGSAIGLPHETLPSNTPLGQRGAEQRGPLVREGGGSDATERAVARALAWLATHQSADGRWDADGFDAHCKACGGETDYEVDHALTGLALLSFMGAGHTHTRSGPYQDAVQRGLRWLLDEQRPDGDGRGSETLYSHGIVTIALAEAFATTGDPQLADPVRRAVRFIERARNTRQGGWRYEPGQEGDTSVLGWQVMALKSAEAGGIPVSRSAYQGARAWLDRVSDPAKPGLYAYRPDHRFTVSMTAEGMFVQELLGTPHDDPRMAGSAAAILEHLPDWSFANTYYWYYATLALYHYGGEGWKTWNAALKPALLENQRADGSAAGSWDPVGEWAPIGGRVYQTAICTLMLEVYYRYLPMYDREADATAAKPGAISGRVTDARTGRPLADARVRLDLPDGAPHIASSGADGRYTLEVPPTIEHVAVSAARDGYVPHSVNVAARGAQRGDTRVDFALEPQSDDVIALEPSPEVHHLGNDRFEGSVNSQFQRPSEGRSYFTRFIVPSDDPATEFARAELTLLAKGVQCPHEIRVNDRRLRGGLPESPPDGSFGEVVIRLDVGLLQSGLNTLRLTTTACHGDLDDFEFVNVQVRLLRE